ncbi:32678_t:CDS:10 [Gigaspora margarita]|uniref:32678_t:CDS:1 n=1 Tax=Gigaspora margarita TaxID=4874 RepID=A0ABN7UHR6_GIGMA|nr:32678_t:CDS:10 [Gigaspora margarita]
MYWASGIAKVLEVRSPDYSKFNDSKTAEQSSVTKTDHSSAILKLKRNKLGNLFVTLTKNSVQLWGFRPTALISQVSRTIKSIEEYGENIDVFWKPDGSLIIVQTNQNCLFTYTVLPFDDKSYKYQFGRVSHHYVSGAGEGNGIKTFLLKFRMTIRIDAGMEAGVGTDEYLIVSTKTPPAIQCIPWIGEPSGTKTNILARLEFLESKEESELGKLVNAVSEHSSVATIRSIVFDRRIDLFGWLTTDGKAYAVQFNENDTTVEKGAKVPPLYWTGYCFHAGGDIESAPKNRATCIAINAKFSLIAVGTEGLVYLIDICPVTSLAWTSDGHAIAVGWQNEGMAVWSVYGRLLMTTVRDDLPQSIPESKDAFLHGINDLFWSSGNCVLFLLHNAKSENDGQLYTLPFAKSADNTKRGFLQMDDRLLLYRGGDQEDLSAINPDTIVWQHIPIPIMYISENWPIKYASISGDGRYIAVAGRRGLAHYNVSSGRWKLFGNQQQEQEFSVRGGLLWFKQFLVAACENVRTHTHETASIIFLIDGKLVLLHPKKSDEGEVQYDLHILADKIEFYWMSTRGIGSLKNSLWACDSQGVKIWMNIWSNEESAKDWQSEVLLSATKECLRIKLEFYPLSVLLDKGIIVGVQQQTSFRQSLEHNQILKYLFSDVLEEESVAFATSYQGLIYFGHALEMLLHHVLEDEAEHTVETGKGCARKTEVALWNYLFSIVGSPKDLFEKCMETGLLKTAASYLLVLHTLEPIADSSKDTIRLLSRAMETEDYELCKELVRFLNSIDGSGKTLKDALSTIQLISSTSDV